MSMNDSQQKTDSLSLLWALGYVVRPELILSEARTQSASRRSAYLDLTDIDVVGYAIGPLLRMDMVSVDCGSGRHRSPMERVFWAKGVMEALGLQQSICVLGTKTEEEHRLAADKLGVTLVSGGEFKNLCDSLVGKCTLHDFTRYYDAYSDWLSYLVQNRNSFSEFVLRDNWAREWDRIPLTLPGQLRKWGAKLDPGRKHHLFTFLELALILSIGLMRVATHIALVQPMDFEGAVYNSVLGGGRRTELVQSLLRTVNEFRSKVLQSQTLFDGSDRSEVAIPHFSELLDVIQRLVSKIGLARQVPRYIQAFQLAQISGSIERYPEFIGGTPDAVVTKLALDVIKYLRLSSDAKSEISDVFSRI
jgi:hypothetical protein